MSASTALQVENPIDDEKILSEMCGNHGKYVAESRAKLREQALTLPHKDKLLPLIENIHHAWFCKENKQMLSALRRFIFDGDNFSNAQLHMEGSRRKLPVAFANQLLNAKPGVEDDLPDVFDAQAALLLVESGNQWSPQIQWALLSLGADPSVFHVPGFERMIQDKKVLRRWMMELIDSVPDATKMQFPIVGEEARPQANTIQDEVDDLKKRVAELQGRLANAEDSLATLLKNQDGFNASMEAAHKHDSEAVADELEVFDERFANFKQGVKADIDGRERRLKRYVQDIFYARLDAAIVEVRAAQLREPTPEPSEAGEAVGEAGGESAENDKKRPSEESEEEGPAKRQRN